MVKKVQDAEQYDGRADKLYEDTQTTIGLKTRRHVAGDPIPAHGAESGQWFPRYEVVDQTVYTIPPQHHTGNVNHGGAKTKTKTFISGRAVKRTTGLTDTTPGLNPGAITRKRQVQWDRPPFHM